MKALIISAAFPPTRSGGADYSMRLCTELAASGMEVYALGPSTSAALEPDNFTLKAAIDSWNWAALNRILDHVRAVKPRVVDIIFTGWLYDDHPMITFLPTFIKRMDASIKVVTHIESLGGVQRSASNVVTAGCRMLCSFVVGRQRLGYEYGSLLRDSDAIIFLGERDRQLLVMTDLAILEKSAVIPPPPIMPMAAPFSAPDRQRRRELLGVAADSYLISFFGYVYPGKGLEHLFAAAQHLLSAGKKVKLVIIGDSPEAYVLRRAGRPDYLQEMKQLCQSLNLNDHVIWLGYSPFTSSAPSEHLHLSDCCVLPFKDGVNQHNSSFWFTAAHRLPIVTTRGEATEAIFQNGKNVIFSENADAISIASAISRLMDNPQLGTDLGTEIGRVAQNQMSWAKCITDTIAVYKGELAPLALAQLRNVDQANSAQQ